ncbi:metallophosphoesterase [Joostella sp. CR20]|uniref:metallophosphoesterase n=1 Tax=Joostella sp. CR20 TaxID=2804312 RepID=UPI00313B7F8B
MKIQYCSDIHYEMTYNALWMMDNPLIPVGDILIIAGDVFYLNEDYKNLPLFKTLSNNFRQTYIVPGNHEYYGTYDAYVSERKINVDLLSNVKLIHNDVVYENDVKFIFSTMWSKIENNKEAIKKGLRDFAYIKYQEKPFTIDAYNHLHNKCFEFIEKEVEEDIKKVVVTHHLPSVLCNAPEHKDSKYNDAFCVDKTDFIANSNIDYWIYGHNHRVLPEIEVNGTKVVSNQLGYVYYNEHTNFKRDKYFEL